MGTEPTGRAASLRGERRGTGSRRRAPRRAPGTLRMRATMRALDEIAHVGARIGIQVSDVDSGHTLLAADAHVALPVSEVGVLPLLVEVACQIRDGVLDPAAPVEPSDESEFGLWSHLQVDELPLGDVAALAASTGDPLASNALLDLVGHENVTRRMVSLGMTRSALLDRFRDTRGPDDAPHAAIGTASEYARLLQRVLRRDGVDEETAGIVTSLLTLRRDVSLVAAPMALDPGPAPSRDDDLLFVGATGRADGVRADTGVVMGRSAALSYALFVEFDDTSLLMRHHVHRAFHTLGEDLLEIVA
ncbi:serine hydrolase [Microbacterium sp. gxy059]|uniref:serine hydrolase n=1 Tax=Microbacterium sp. gxy059 TaxID=2957199 RepID=UPI003D95DE1D